MDAIDRPRIQQLRTQNSADSEFEDLHTTDTPIHHVSNKLNETWNILQKEDEHRALQNIIVRNSNFGPILYRFGVMTAFMCSWSHFYSTPILGVFPLHQITHVVRQRALSYSVVKLFSKNSNRCKNIPQRHGQTDGRTDGRTDDLLSHHRALR